MLEVMKKFFLFVIFAFTIIVAGAQNYIYEQKHEKWDFVRETAVSAGIGIGGNSVFGTELQVMFVPRWSAQLGVGIGGFSGGVNYHINPTVSSPYISLQAWQQGFGKNYKAAYAGPMFVYRADRLLQAGLGLGYQIDRNPALEFNSKYMLMFNLGIYLPM